MTTCFKGNPQSIESLLNYPVEPEVTDPQGKTAAFYALKNNNEEYANDILNLLLLKFPQLVFLHLLRFIKKPMKE